MINAIFSIRPQYAHAIIKGIKKYEYRKKIPKQQVDKVYVYSAHPEKMIVGYFTIKKIHCDSPLNIWLKTWDQGGISAKEYEKYFAESDQAYAIEIKKAVQFKHPIEFKKIDPTGKIPQSFKYLKDI